MWVLSAFLVAARAGFPNEVAARAAASVFASPATHVAAASGSSVPRPGGPSQPAPVQESAPAAKKPARPTRGKDPFDDDEAEPAPRKPAKPDQHAVAAHMAAAKLFGQLDKDGDYRITEDELQGLRPVTGGGRKGGFVTPEDLIIMDVNDDGVVELDEAKAHFRRVSERGGIPTAPL